ncbi:MAG: PTS sugar transporter subunit IIA [Betaproteobacteria bacterium]|nr:PTS sugar transporter subunit IIA [Betaproteobacteria bacterium]
MGRSFPDLSQLLKPSHVVIDVEVTSKKRLFEQIGLLFENHHQLSMSRVFEALFNRERLGSTGLGCGFALPHGRLKGIRETLAAFFRLKNEIPFDAPDGQPVRLIFVLLVPDHANEQHLRLLGEIAERFSDPELRQALLSVSRADLAYQLLIQSPNHAIG